MADAFAAVPGIQVSSSPAELPPDLAAFPIVDRAGELPKGALVQLQSSSDADVLLRFGISDYGTTPKAWRQGVIAFEVISTLGIAAVAYARPATRAIAGAYLVQEAIEEGIEAYSGFWALDQVYRPVRVEAEMIDLKSGNRIWSDSETGLSDRRLSRIFRTVPKEEREAQLSVSLRDAIAKLISDFRKSFGTNGSQY